MTWDWLAYSESINEMRIFHLPKFSIIIGVKIGEEILSHVIALMTPYKSSLINRFDVCEHGRYVNSTQR